MTSAGLTPSKIISPDIDEGIKRRERPIDYVKRMANLKVTSIATPENCYLITADTIVTKGRMILPKTYDEVEAKNYLRLLSGKRHKVFTAVCIKNKNKIRSFWEKTILKMRFLSDKEIGRYISTGEWKGKAGGYGIQGKANSFFPFISGCFSNIVGLPIPKLIGVLTAMGFFLDHDK